jgi:hypothetical protein
VWHNHTIAILSMSETIEIKEENICPESILVRVNAWHEKFVFSFKKKEGRTLPKEIVAMTLTKVNYLPLRKCEFV